MQESYVEVRRERRKSTELSNLNLCVVHFVSV